MTFTESYLFKALSATPAIFRNLSRATPVNRFDEALSSDRFTYRQALAHLADWEPIWRTRISAFLTEDHPQIIGEDEGQRCIDLNYNSWDIEETVEKFATERAETIKVLGNLSPKDLAKIGVHSERGDLSALDLVGLILGHDVYHIEQFSQYLS